MNEELRKLEEKIAFLEHHVTEQDKVMLGFSEELTRLKREIKRMAERVSEGVGGAPGRDGGALDERPPHY